MITVYLQGGCANQLFQFAAAKAVAIKLNQPLRLNVSSFINDSMRQYSLGLFAGVNEETTYEFPEKFYMERSMRFDPALFDFTKEDFGIRGYFQTEKYFHDLRHILVNTFVPKQPITQRAFNIQSDILKAGNRSVFLTIRRTDYVKSNFHGLLGMDYYEEALKVVAGSIGDPAVFVFSDEPEWVKDNFSIPYSWTLCGNFDRTTRNHLGREDEELWLMSQCRHAIMANSSYSWWGAWMAPFEGHIDRVVIAPKKWFGPESKEDTRDIIPERWIRL